MFNHTGDLLTDNQAMAYVYAAYKRGKLIIGEPDLERDAFASMFERWLKELIGSGSQAIVIRAKVNEIIPVGLVIIDYQGTTAYPDIHWFPEASPRNRVECGLYLMLELKKEHMVFFTVPGITRNPEPDWKFLMHLCKYGVLRPVGTIRDHNGEGEHATLFQSVGS